MSLSRNFATALLAAGLSLPGAIRAAENPGAFAGKVAPSTSNSIVDPPDNQWPFKIVDVRGKGAEFASLLAKRLSDEKAYSVLIVRGVDEPLIRTAKTAALGAFDEGCERLILVKGDVYESADAENKNIQRRLKVASPDEVKSSKIELYAAGFFVDKNDPDAGADNFTFKSTKQAIEVTYELTQIRFKQLTAVPTTPAND